MFQTKGFSYVIPIIIVVSLLTIALIGSAIIVTTREKLRLNVATPSVTQTDSGVRVIQIPYMVRWKSLKIANEAAAQSVVVSCSAKGSSVAQSNPLATDTLEIADSLTIQVKDPTIYGNYRITCVTYPDDYKATAVTTIDLPKETQPEVQPSADTTSNSNQATTTNQLTFVDPADLSKSVWTYTIAVGGGLSGELTFDNGLRGDVKGVYNENGPSGFRALSFTGTYSAKTLSLNLDGTLYTLTLADDYKSMQGKPADVTGGIAYPDTFFTAIRK